MKKKLFLIAIAFVVIFTSQNILAAGISSEFEDYSISKVDNLFLGKDTKAIWKISYSSTEVPLTVVKKKTSRGTEYVVHSKYFDVSYVVSDKGFGVKNVNRASRSVPKKISSAVIDQDQMKKQQIITPNQVDDKMALGLIASFLPELINDGYKHLLN